MIASLINRLTILPRWVIIIIDLTVISLSTLLAYFLRFNFNWSIIVKYDPFLGIFLNAVCGFSALLLTRSYAGIVRYTGVEDGFRIIYSTAISLTMAFTVNFIHFYSSGKNIIPYSVLFISFFTSFLFLFYYRLLVKAVFSYYKGEVAKKSNVAIFGAGSLGMITCTAIETDSDSKFKVVAFFEEDTNKVGKVINGVKIYPWISFDEVVNRLRIKHLIIAVKDLGKNRKNEIVERCLSNHVKVRIVPPADKWVKGEFRVQQLKEVNIDDLLGRDVIRLSDDSLMPSLFNKKICITGAAGSIGSELARQLIQFHPQSLCLIDQAETPLFELERELRELNLQVKLESYIADITNKSRIENLISSFNPQILFHAAAYKHVPVMEANPNEAILTNVLGTRILADVAVTYGVEKFVMISTDKAVKPSSVMGCSKRIAEIYVQSLAHHLEKQGGQYTQFITTRFGNVLGSSGSVIPSFKRQIEEGGPVTVTHPEITRYFMTIPEACRLVLEAGVMGKGGEIFIFDMGEPIRILDLAKKMIRLSGYEPGKDIEIIYTGLRPGEKLHEELLDVEEDTIPTHHPKILKARVREYDYYYVLSMIDLLQDMIADKNELKLLAIMKEIVPEYAYNKFNHSASEANYLRL
ncbi:MAG: polysaccharide biosynthesis protein [Cyclobacteriaceae bacterium]|nr:polysaccharide biosynthesis protein [Cyclobacteriaceae bacterium]